MKITYNIDRFPLVKVDFNDESDPENKYYEEGKLSYTNYYNEDGKLSYRNYHNEDGYKFEFYYKNGKIRSKGEYKNGEKIGNWVEYNELGEIIKNEQYD